MSQTPKGTVFFIGAGPGDPELVTLKGARLIANAGLVLYTGSLVPQELLQRHAQGATVIDSAELTLETIHRLMRVCVCQGQDCARVHTGDPSLYGALREEIACLEQDGIAWQVVPGVTAATAAAAAVGREKADQPGRPPVRAAGHRLPLVAQHAQFRSGLLCYQRAGLL